MTSLMIDVEHLECHFNWKPEQNSTIEDYGELILKVENKCKEYPEGITAYRCIIGYLYAIPGPQVDYERSGIEFDQLLDPSNPFGALDDFRCDYIVRANKLILEVQKWKIKKVDSEEVKRELEELSELWQLHEVRMLVYLIKGITLLCFGCTKFELSSDAYRKALVSTSKVYCSNHQRFIIISGLAYACSKVMRQTSRDCLRDEEVRLWQQASDILEENEDLHIHKARFYVYYAFALPDDDEKKAQKIEKVHEIIQKDDRLDRVPIMRCIRLAKRTKQFKIRNALIQKAMERPENLQHGNFYYELSRCYSYKDPGENDKAIEILKTGVEKAAVGKKHLFLDVELINRQRKIKGKDWAHVKYETLMAKYKDTRNRSIIRSFWASDIFYNEIRNNVSSDSEILGSLVDELIVHVVDAFESYPLVTVPLSFSKLLIDFLEERKLRPEFLGWLLENIRGKNAFVSSTRIQNLYKSAIEDPEATSDRKDFAKLHLGKSYLNKNKIVYAKDLFKQLPDSCLEKKYLLSESVLKDENSSMEDLIQCMQLGNCDVIKLVLKKLEDSKREQLTKMDSVLEEGFFIRNEMFFNASSYELCSSILGLLDSENAFSINREEVSRDFVETIEARVHNYLGISDSNLLRLYRLDAMRLSQSGQHNKMNRGILGVLSEARKELDRSMKKLGPQKHKFFYPRVVKSDFMKDEEEMKKNFGLSLEEIEERITKDLKECKVSSSDDLIKFLVNREHYIITKEAAWQVVWMNAINEDKHEKQLDLADFEKNVLNAQKVAGIDPGIRSALDVTHKIAEYVEQTLLVFDAVLSRNT